MELEDDVPVCLCGYAFKEDVLRRMTKWAKFFDYHKLNAKYSALYLIALILDVLAIVSLLGIVFGIVTSFRDASFLMIIFTVVSGILGYLILKAFAEIIILFIGIEENTSRNNNLLESILDSLRDRHPPTK